jgi:hypothetical protein
VPTSALPVSEFPFIAVRMPGISLLYAASSAISVYYALRNSFHDMKSSVRLVIFRANALGGTPCGGPKSQPEAVLKPCQNPEKSSCRCSPFRPLFPQARSAAPRDECCKGNYGINIPFSIDASPNFFHRGPVSERNGFG